MSGGFALRGVFGVLPTAFGDDGSLDLAGTASLVRAYVGAGVTGLTVLGALGEAAELSETERGQVLATVLREAAGIAVVVGVTGASHDLVAGRARDAAAQGVAALMVSPSQTLGVADAVAAAAEGGVAIVIQDYPIASGVLMTADEMGAVAERQPLVAGVKAESPPTSGVIARLRECWPSLAAMGGLGGLFLIDELRAGATGTMTGFALPERLVSIVGTFATDPAVAEREWTALLPLMRLEAFSPFNLVARKEVWRLRGVIGSAHCRRVGARLDDTAREDIRRAYAAVTESAAP